MTNVKEIELVPFWALLKWKAIWTNADNNGKTMWTSQRRQNKNVWMSCLRYEVESIFDCVIWCFIRVEVEKNISSHMPFSNLLIIATCNTCLERFRGHVWVSWEKGTKIITIILCYKSIQFKFSLILLLNQCNHNIKLNFIILLIILQANIYWISSVPSCAIHFVIYLTQF